MFDGARRGLDIASQAPENIMSFSGPFEIGPQNGPQPLSLAETFSRSNGALATNHGWQFSIYFAEQNDGGAEVESLFFQPQ